MGRIWFPGNPWPDGHRIEEFAWTGRLDDAGRLWFDLTLRTGPYDEAGVAEDRTRTIGRTDHAGGPRGISPEPLDRPVRVTPPPAYGIDLTRYVACRTC